MSSRKGPPKHQNVYAWKANAGHKKNDTELGGKLRPYSDITGVCPRCKDQIEWKRRYGKYKPLLEPAKCQRCGKRAVRQAYHTCSKDLDVCAKCSCRVDKIIGRDILEVEAERKVLEEAIRNARERDRRTLLRAMSSSKTIVGAAMNRGSRGEAAVEAAAAADDDDDRGEGDDDDDDDDGERAASNTDWHIKVSCSSRI